MVDLGASPYDEWDVLRKAVRAGVPVDPRTPPAGSKGINVMLQPARGACEAGQARAGRSVRGACCDVLGGY